MSRVGKKIITVPENVEVSIEDRKVLVKGPKGELEYTMHPYIEVSQKDDNLEFSSTKKGKRAGAIWGTTRARIASIIKGVTEGYAKELEVQGVGYKAQIKGTDLELSVGYSHPVTVTPPEGITLSTEKEIIKVEGIDPVLVGQVAADIRKVRKPEPYKGKGIRYKDEQVRRKVGKVVGSTD